MTGPRVGERVPTAPAETEYLQPFIAGEGWKADAHEAPSEGGRRAADLHGIIRDLELIESICTKLIEELYKPEVQRDLTLATALGDAALIRYRRCFAHGLRHRLEVSTVESVALALMSVHRHFIDSADKNVAHSVNNKEVLEAALYLDGETSQVRGHAIVAMFGHESQQNIADLRELAGRLRQCHAEPEYARALAQFEEDVEKLGSEPQRGLERLLIPFGPLSAPAKRPRKQRSQSPEKATCPT